MCRLSADMSPINLMCRLWLLCVCLSPFVNPASGYPPTNGNISLPDWISDLSIPQRQRARMKLPVPSFGIFGRPCPNYTFKLLSRNRLRL
ncbi:hypothetical protein C8J57DRAFT_1347354 [Mycena rebaudengoi]|nr:hypothetical protein C8J57DRAFT_1373387 [Mycena rebaudengoi]KAJ7254121.1 hypothetical protein C8J57DRAFT_1347354 [Mycena rebaudengoi]